ncbi:cell division protein ZapB [Halomontanus rarus]|uniref:cell division protein ZapB n=1 Tax=Halomontanus rarus TaxID=3034020 RepID=UPI001F61E8D1
MASETVLCEPSTDRSLETAVRTLTEELEMLRQRTDQLTDRVDELETENESLVDENARLRSRVRGLECETDDLGSRTDHLEEQTTELETQTTTLETQTTTLESETDRLENRTTAVINRSGANKARIEELQARELEKGAHLLEENVDQHDLEIDGGRLERIRKDDDRTYYRLPDADDPLGRGGSVTLAHADLLPIQQLARMDEDMLRSTTNSLPSRLAAKLWNVRSDPTAGDDPWQSGCKNVREYVKASDLKHWIRRQEPGTSDAYAKKLVSRTIDALLDLSKNRLAIRRKRERKNGLEYTERRILLTADAEIPGETGATGTANRHGDAPKTADVTGER